jgi:hypothetical protein
MLCTTILPVLVFSARFSCASFCKFFDSKVGGRQYGTGEFPAFLNDPDCLAQIDCYGTSGLSYVIFLRIFTEIFLFFQNRPKIAQSVDIPYIQSMLYVSHVKTTSYRIQKME